MQDGFAGDGLRLDGVRIALGQRDLLAVDAVVPPGSVLSVMGPSGSGKSSLLAYIGGFLDPDTLSGGQKARVALQRTLLSAPRLLLLDEPFSRLDLDLRAQVRQLVFDQARSAKLPVVLVTHDPADAEAAGGTVIEIGGDTP